MNNRIALVRSNSGMTQEEFAAKLGLSQNFIWMLEKGSRIPSDRTISDICREFKINETWLRTGEGEMMAPRTDDERITEFLDDVLASKPDIRRRLISALARLDPEDWDLIEKMIDKIAGDEKEAAPE